MWNSEWKFIKHIPRSSYANVIFFSSTEPDSIGSSSRVSLVYFNFIGNNNGIDCILNITFFSLKSRSRCARFRTVWRIQSEIINTNTTFPIVISASDQSHIVVVPISPIKRVIVIACQSRMCSMYRQLVSCLFISSSNTLTRYDSSYLPRAWLWRFQIFVTTSATFQVETERASEVIILSSRAFLKKGKNIAKYIIMIPRVKKPITLLAIKRKVSERRILTVDGKISQLTVCTISSHARPTVVILFVSDPPKWLEK